MHDALLAAAKKIAPLLKKVSREVVAKDSEMSTAYKQATEFLSSLNRSSEAESAEEYRKTIRATEIDFERAIASRNSFYDKDETENFKRLGDHLKVEPPSKTHVHMTTKPKQAAYINNVIDAFFRHIGVDIPEDETEKKASFINILKKAVRNHTTASMIKKAVASAGGSINKEPQLDR